MTLSFRNRYSVPDTMVFEQQFEPGLQISLDDKIELLAHCPFKVWLLADGKLAGETYGVSPAVLYHEFGDEVEDSDPFDDLSLYTYSTTVLPEFRGKGFSKILKAYTLGWAKAAGYNKVTGHATQTQMVFTNADFGARFGPYHENWYDTDRVAFYYEIDL